METLRHFIALGLVVVTLPLLGTWFIIHPWIRLWRRLGAVPTYAIVGTVIFSEMMLLVHYRHRLLAVDFGTRWALVALGLVILAVAVRMRRAIHRELPLHVLLGFPEVDPRRLPIRLITGGPYARVRHPRYLEFLAGVLGWALVANYLAGYAVLMLSVAVIPAVVFLEERELCQRFGAAYREYCRKVPRFVPRRGGAAASSRDRHEGPLA